MTKKTSKLCDNCDSPNVKTHPTTYPVTMGEKQLNIGRVWVKECMDCNTMKPTKAGEEKISRSVFAFMSLLSGR